MSHAKLNEHHVQALRLVNHGNGGGLTHHAQTIVSRQAKYLLDAELIAYAPERRNVGFKLTLKGYAALKEADPNYTRYVDYFEPLPIKGGK